MSRIKHLFLAVAVFGLMVGSVSAKIQFLPDFTDSDIGWANNSIKNPANKGENCQDYKLSACPAGAICTTCPFNPTKLKLNSCKNGWKISGDSCTPASCESINSSYKPTIPTNEICTKTNEDGLTCYKDCRAISCSGYTLNYDTFNVAYSTSKTMCPDCESATANCLPKLAKVETCQDGYKVANGGTNCVALDDNCPTNYYKTCDTTTQGDPQYTEKGSACYQCKPQIQSCAQYIAANRSDLTVINSFEDLQHALIDNKNNFALTNNLSVTAGINLSGKTIIGQNSVLESPLCTKMSSPKLTITETITTNDSTIVENLDFINAMPQEGNYDNFIPMINGGGKFTSVKMTLDPSLYVYEINSYKPFITAQGVLTLKDVTAIAAHAFNIKSYTTVNLQGTINRICNTPKTHGAGISVGFHIDKENNIKVNIDPSATVTMSTPNNTMGFRMFDDWGSNNTININGKINFASSQYGAELIVGKAGIININHPISVAALSNNSGTININAATTINAETPESSIVAIVISNTGRLNVNAPVTINNFRADTYSNAVSAEYIYLNDTMTFNRKNFIKTKTLNITSKGRVIGATKR